MTIAIAYPENNKEVMGMSRHSLGEGGVSQKASEKVYALLLSFLGTNSTQL